MKGIAIESWSVAKEQTTLSWLDRTFGESSKETWYVDQDYDLVTLCLSDEAYVMYKLKWE